MDSKKILCLFWLLVVLPSIAMQPTLLDDKMQVAIKQNDLPTIRSLLMNISPVNHVFSGGMTALMYACALGCSDIASSLIQKGADIDAKSTENGTALHMACSNGHFEIVKLLINALPHVPRERIEALDNVNRTPLHLACQQGHYDIVRLLIEKGAHINAMADERLTPLQLACREQHYEVAQLLITRSAGIRDCVKDDPVFGIALENAKQTNQWWKYLDEHNIKGINYLLDRTFDANVKDSYGNTGLHKACNKGDRELVQLLIKYIPVNSENKQGSTPLHAACCNGHTEIARELITNHAKVNVVDLNLRTPLYYACQNGDVPTAVLLLENRANTETIAQDNPTLKTAYESLVCVKAPHSAGAHKLWFSALDKLDVESIKMYVQQGFDVNTKDGRGCTGLDLACLKGCFRIAYVLIAKNAHIDTKNTQGAAPLHLVCSAWPDRSKEYERLKIAALLVARGASVDVTDNQERTPLSLACLNGYSEIAKLLINSLRSEIRSNIVNLPDNAGYTPLHCACCNGHAPVVKLLIAQGADCKVTAHDKSTPRQFAENRKFSEIVQLLDAASDAEQTRPLPQNPVHYASGIASAASGANQSDSDGEHRASEPPLKKISRGSQ